MIRIESKNPVSFQIENHDGTPINGVGGFTIVGKPCQITTATIELQADKVDIEAHPLLGRETLEWSADALGLKLVAKGEPEDPVLHAIAQRLARIEAILLQQQEASNKAVMDVIDILRR